MMGEDDPIGRGADLLGHERNAPRLTVERVPGAGHFLPEERPDVVVERARGAVRGRPPERAGAARPQPDSARSLSPSAALPSRKLRAMSCAGPRSSSPSMRPGSVASE